LSLLDFRFVNGVAGDPAVIAIPSQQSDWILFDCGDLTPLTNKEILKIKTVCVSHTHMDHFFGFDRLIRVNVPLGRPLTIIGPKDIALHVQAKLKSYTWNLIESGQIHYEVFEVTDGGVLKRFEIGNDDGFAVREVSGIEAGGLSYVSIPIGSGQHQATIRATVLDHGTPVCAYGVYLPDDFQVQVEALTAAGLTPGPWIGQLQKAVQEGNLLENVDTGTGSLETVQSLRDRFLKRRSGDSCAYVTDIVFSEGNQKRIAAAFKDVTALICETNYKHEHEDRAFSKKHLTTKQAAALAKLVGCQRLMTFHFSNLYAGDYESVAAEAQGFFN
jgi:ribonuclease Z